LPSTIDTHFAGGRWQRGPGDPTAGDVVAGDGLSRGPAEVLATLLHEGAHGAAAARSSVTHLDQVDPRLE
jgi:hypothetical protein